MEKPGMDRKILPPRSRLLSPIVLVLCLVYPVLILDAQTGTMPDEDPLTVEVQTSPEEPELNTPWIVTFLVDHPSPMEVTVQHPPIPPSLTLESIRIGARIVGQTAGTRQRWTAVEFWFTIQQPGTISLKPFEISTPDKSILTDTISLYIQGAIQSYPPYFSWGTLPGSLKIGEPGELSLRLINWDSRKPLPGQELFQQEVPPQVILEEQPLSESDRKQGIILRLGVIPLGGQRFTLKPIRFQHEGLTLEIPGLSIPLIPFKKEELGPGIAQGNQEEREPFIPQGAMQTPLIPSFPEIAPWVFPLCRFDYEKGVQRSRNLWNEGHIPEALAEIRRNERESLAGPYFASLRQEAEQSLGFELTQDEKWRPRILLLLGSLSILILLALWTIHKVWLFVLKRREVTFRLFWGYNSVVIILIAVLGIPLFALIKGMIHQDHREMGLAVLRTATAYRVPDEDSGVSAYFSGGQPVMIRSISESWAYVESFDGRLGWILRDEIIIY